MTRLSNAPWQCKQLANLQNMYGFDLSLGMLAAHIKTTLANHGALIPDEALKSFGLEPPRGQMARMNIKAMKSCSATIISQEPDHPVLGLSLKSSRHESGGWDGYNIDVNTLSFLMPVRALVHEIPRTLILMCVSQFESSRHLQTNIALFDDPKDIQAIASKMGPDGYGDNPGYHIVEAAKHLWDLEFLLHPSRIEKELIDQAASETHRHAAGPRI